MPRSDEDFSREVEAHLQHETDRLIADGVSPEEARRAARRAFGNVARVSERFYESRRVLWLDHPRHDVRCAFRSIGRTPIACAVAVCVARRGHRRHYRDPDRPQRDLLQSASALSRSGTAVDRFHPSPARSAA